MSPSTSTSSGATITRFQYGPVASAYPSCPIRPLAQAGVALPLISWDELLGRR